MADAKVKTVLSIGHGMSPTELHKKTKVTLANTYLILNMLEQHHLIWIKRKHRHNKIYPTEKMLELQHHLSQIVARL